MTESGYTVVPKEGHNYEGRQSGWRVLRKGVPVLYASVGGTGPCWNLAAGHEQDDDCMLHVCELDELLIDLLALTGRGGGLPAQVGRANAGPTETPEISFLAATGGAEGDSFGVYLGADGVVHEWEQTTDGERTDRSWSMPARDCAWVEHAPGEWWLDYQGARADGVRYAPTRVADVHKDGTIDLWGYCNGQMPGDEEADPTRLFIEDLDVVTAAVLALRNSDADRLNNERWDVEWKPFAMPPGAE